MIDVHKYNYILKYVYEYSFIVTRSSILKWFFLTLYRFERKNIQKKLLFFRLLN